MITLTAAVSYYAMATRSGTTLKEIGSDHCTSIDAPRRFLTNSADREIYYARYVDWSITTP